MITATLCCLIAIGALLSFFGGPRVGPKEFDIWFVCIWGSVFFVTSCLAGWVSVSLAVRPLKHIKIESSTSIALTLNIFFLLMLNLFDILHTVPNVNDQVNFIISVTGLMVGYQIAGVRMVRRNSMDPIIVDPCAARIKPNRSERFGVSTEARKAVFRRYSKVAALFGLAVGIHAEITNARYTWTGEGAASNIGAMLGIILGQIAVWVLVARGLCWTIIRFGQSRANRTVP